MSQTHRKIPAYVEHAAFSKREGLFCKLLKGTKYLGSVDSK